MAVLAKKFKTIADGYTSSPLFFGALSFYGLLLFIDIRVVRFSASGIQISYFIAPGKLSKSDNEYYHL
jgi:hypothetical protein